jgi:CTP:molybdopterin cytidylyltransferase MocA
VPHREHIAGVLLAAGPGTRFGGDKVVVALDGEPLVRHVAASLVRAGVRELVVVTPPDPSPVEKALAGLGNGGRSSPPVLRIVPNPHAARGLGSSIATGIASLGAEVEVAIIALADQPRVPDAVLQSLLAAWRGTGAPIVAPRYAGGVRGYPIVFDADVFRELSRLDGDEGVQPVLARSVDRVRLVDFDVATPVDVDTPEDLARL